MRQPPEVKLVEVGPRDGLQNEARVLPAALRVEFIERLSRSGLPVIEAGSMVSVRRVPQMADTDMVLRSIRRCPHAAYPVLVPNLLGLEAAVAAGASDIAVFTAATEAFCQANIACSLAESLQRIEAVCGRAKSEGLAIRGYVSCALGCPYEGRVAPERVTDVALRLYDLGCSEISLGDTLGIGTPGKARVMVKAVAGAIPIEAVAVHFHDTYGQALANILAVLDLGVAVVDASVGGLGGCPFAPGAAGNVATEEVLYMLDGLGVETGVDLDRLLEAGEFIGGALGRSASSKVARARRGACQFQTS